MAKNTVVVFSRLIGNEKTPAPFIIPGHADIDKVSQRVAKYIHSMIPRKEGEGAMYGVGVAKSREDGGDVSVFGGNGEDLGKADFRYTE